MSFYIASNDNRLYVQSEAAFGRVESIAPENRIPVVKLAIKTEREHAARKDKTGRTFRGLPTGLRMRTKFKLNTYLASWSAASSGGYGPLFASAMGSTGIYFGGGTALANSPTSLTFENPHGLQAGQGITCAGEMRFVTTIQDTFTVDVNAPFAVIAGSAVLVGESITYIPGDQHLSTSVFDYWSPEPAVNRIVSGAVVDEFSLKINADYHEFQFAGPAAEVIDNTSFSTGQAGLDEFIAEPDVQPFDYEIIPGHMGQVWMGTNSEQFFTLTGADLHLKNDVELRATEFGMRTPVAFFPGVRDVEVRFSIYETLDSPSRELNQAARQQSPISVMFQLGEDPGHLFGAYMKSVVPEVPEFDDEERRLKWRFSNCRAHGTSNDELVLAFG